MNVLHVSKSTPARIALICLLVVLATIGSLFQAGKASAHGYVDGPASRSALCKSGANTNCGAIVYEPQSLEAPKGFPAAGPADGQIASAGGKFPELDQQSAARWTKVNMSSGTNAFTWTLTANHSTTSWKYYITKPTWDPNRPLSRSSFDLTPFCSIAYNNAQPASGHTDTCNVPQRSGYQVILAVWEIADTGNAFYNVIDANFSGTNPVDTTVPTAPTQLKATAAATSVSLSWAASTDNVGVTGYKVYKGSTLVANVTGTSYTITGLTASTAYTFTVKAIDAAGNESSASSSLKVITTTPPATDSTPPTLPMGLHIMGTPTASSMMLMWTASTDNVGVTGYTIYNGSTLVTTTSGTADSYTVTGLAANKTYNFTVYAIDAAGNQSVGSTVSGTTATAEVPAIAAWATNTSYTRGTLVTYNGHTYKCLQSHKSIYTWTPTVTPALWEMQK